MKGFFSSWKTTLLGLGAGAFNAAANGTSWKSIGLSSAMALLGMFASDHKDASNSAPTAKGF